MKKVMALFLLMITLSSLTGVPAVQSTSAREIHNIQRTTKKATDKIVYIAKDKKYHRSNCRHMGFINQVRLSNAQKNGYTPCRVCNP